MAGDTPYWNPKTETLERERLEALQLAKLRRQCEWAAARSPWYQRRFAEAGFEPAPAAVARRPAPDPAADARRLDGLAGRRARRTARSRRSAATARSASTRRRARPGRGPLRALDSRKDWAWIAEMWCYALWGCGVRPRRHRLHRVRLRLVHRLLGPSLRDGEDRRAERARRRADRPRRACARSSTSARPWSPRPRPTRCASRRRPQIQGLDLRGSAVQRLILSGEPAGSIPQTKALIEEQWGAKAYDTAGMTEIGTIMVFECSHQPGGTHIIEDHVIEEVLDPGDARAGGVRRARRARRHLVRARRDPADPLPDRRPGVPGARLDVRLRPRVRHLRGRHPRPRRRHEDRPRHQCLPARDRGDRPRVPRGRRVPDGDHARGDPRRDHAARRAEARLARWTTGTR